MTLAQCLRDVIAHGEYEFFEFFAQITKIKKGLDIQFGRKINITQRKSEVLWRCKAWDLGIVMLINKEKGKLLGPELQVGFCVFTSTVSAQTTCWDRFSSSKTICDIKLKPSLFFTYTKLHMSVLLPRSVPVADLGIFKYLYAFLNIMAGLKWRAQFQPHCWTYLFWGKEVKWSS